MKKVKIKLLSFLDNPIGVAFTVFLFSLIIISSITIIYYEYNKELLKNIFVEAHGLLFEILIIGTLIVWLDLKRERRMLINSYKNEIDDYREWKEKEAKHRIIGKINRLSEMGINNVDLKKCYLEEGELKYKEFNSCNHNEVIFRSAKLRNINFRECLLMVAEFDWSELILVSFINCIALDISFEHADAKNVNFSGSHMDAGNFNFCNLQGADFKDASLYKASFQGANLVDAKNLTINQLSKVLTLFNAKLNENIMIDLMKKKPELFKEIDPLDRIMP